MKRAAKRILLALGAAVGLAAAGLLWVNVASLHDGVLYLRDLLRYDRETVQPLDSQGPLGMCATLVSLKNLERARFIEGYVQARGLAVERVALPNSYDILVRFAAQGPYTLFSAHYDKLYDDPAYQGASDNTAAVCVLLAAADALVKQGPGHPVAFLWTGEEEQGLVGARAFVPYARANGFEVAEAINFDNLGRDGIGARPHGERAGWYFTLPGLGERVYDGRTFWPGAPYRDVNADVIARLRRVAPVTVSNRMILRSDGNIFEEAGWPAVTLSSDNHYYLEQTWHTYGDRLELLDQDHLLRAVDLVVRYARGKP